MGNRAIPEQEQKFEIVGEHSVSITYDFTGKQIKNHHMIIKCLVCGTERIVLKQNIKDTVCQSEVCRKKIEAYSNTRLYRIWSGIKGRCYCKTQTAYKRYGAKGIKMCDSWKDNYMNFYEWAMSHGYTDELSIDRINSKGNYEPKNCRWATDKQQMANRSNTAFVTVNNETLTLAAWAERLHVPRTRLSAYLSGKLKKTIEEYIQSVINKENDDV